MIKHIVQFSILCSVSQVIIPGVYTVATNFIKVNYLFAYGLFKKVTIMFKAWPPTPWAGHSFPIRHHFAIASGRTTKGRHT